uniref:Uncharacterized protein n=1 Tax=Aegilops tauschii subsp. strangulata TaxID=200361 RepID=A0A453Q559_AEGTS
RKLVQILSRYDFSALSVFTLVSPLTRRSHTCRSLFSSSPHFCHLTGNHLVGHHLAYFADHHLSP